MKLYRNTLVLCAVIFIVCVLLSCLFEFSCWDESFFKDYAIGIACSIIVVFITTYLQFKFEQRRLLNSMLLEMKMLLSNYSYIIFLLDPSEEATAKNWNYEHDEFYKKLRSISDGLRDIEWFSAKKQKIAWCAQSSVISLLLQMFGRETNEESLKKIIGSHHIEELKDNLLKLVDENNDYYKDIVNGYKTAKEHLNEMIEMGYWDENNDD